MIEDPEDSCPLCERLMHHPSDHHLVPKSRGGRETLTICSDCHSAAHGLFSNRQLADRYNTPEALMADKRFARAVAFISKQDPRKRHRTKRSRDRH